MTSPTKKVLTNDVKAAIDASNTRRDAIVPEDLNQALQSLGMRVRKSVTEGYNMDRVTSFTVPITPNSSPAKPTTIHSTPTNVFRTANDALNFVFPVGSPRIPVTPSPKKRTRAEVGLNAGTRQNFDEDVEMDGHGANSDEDPIMVILGPNANATAFTPPRKIKPLRGVRRGMASSQSNFVDPFAFTGQASSVDAPLLASHLGDMQEDTDMDPSEACHDGTA